MSKEQVGSGVAADDEAEEEEDSTGDGRRQEWADLDLMLEPRRLDDKDGVPYDVLPDEVVGCLLLRRTLISPLARSGTLASTKSRTNSQSIEQALRETEKLDGAKNHQDGSGKRVFWAEEDGR